MALEGPGTRLVADITLVTKGQVKYPLRATNTKVKVILVQTQFKKCQHLKSMTHEDETQRLYGKYSSRYINNEKSIRTSFSSRRGWIAFIIHHMLMVFIMHVYPKSHMLSPFIVNTPQRQHFCNRVYTETVR